MAGSLASPVVLAKPGIDVLAATPAMAEAAMNLRREIPVDFSMVDLL
jgi:hypothetical protein